MVIMRATAVGGKAVWEAISFITHLSCSSTVRTSSVSLSTKLSWPSGTVSLLRSLRLAASAWAVDLRLLLLLGSSLDSLLRDRLELLSIDERRLGSECVDEFLGASAFRSMVQREGKVCNCRDAQLKVEIGGTLCSACRALSCCVIGPFKASRIPHSTSHLLDNLLPHSYILKPWKMRP
jgi:hypothetical protein